MEMLDSQGHIVGHIARTHSTQMIHGRRIRRVECIAQLLLPGQPAVYRRFPDVWEARAWIARMASTAGVCGVVP